MAGDPEEGPGGSGNARRLPQAASKALESKSAARRPHVTPFGLKIAFIGNSISGPPLAAEAEMPKRNWQVTG